ncbi:MAG: MBL fold metallo-hydrolase [Caldisericaceae bacterium]
METIVLKEITILEFTFGGLSTNCYIIDNSGEIALIDASNSNDDENVAIYNAIKARGVLKYIINTHGHFDHIAGNNFLKDKFPDAMLLIHSNDREKLSSPELNGSLHFGKHITSVDCDMAIGPTLKQIHIGRTKLEFIYTPGHTKGSISVRGKGIVFTGDTLFQGTVGIAKEYKGAFNELIDSIKTKLLTLPQDFIILPGHGNRSTVSEEAQFNPFLV